MSILSFLLLIFILIIFSIGLAGIFLPVIPSLPVIWVGILLYAIFTNFNEVTGTIVFVTGVLMIFGTVFDFVVGILGAKFYGASLWGILGAMIGSVVGVIIFNIPGLFIGSFVGAFGGEYMRYRKMHSSIKAGLGTIFGFIFGVVMKIFISFSMIGIFIFALF